MGHDTAHASPENVNDLLRKGIAAAKRGQREQARNLLTRVVDLDEENSLAWLWLSGVVDGLEDQEICLENVLTLNPDNAAARKGLAWVQQQKAAQVPPLPPPMPEHLPEDPADVESPPTTPPEAEAATPLVASSSALASDTEPETSPVSPRSADPFDDEYLCPYCAAQTQPKDRKCQACNGNLWVRLRRREKPSSWFWVLLTLQLFNTILFAIAPLLVLVYVGFNVGVLDPMKLLDVYLGTSTTSSPEVADAAFAIVPRFALFLSTLPFFPSLVLLIGLFLRWKPVYYLLLIEALLELILAIAGIVVTQGLIFGGGSVVLALARLLLLFQIEDDFSTERRRLVLRVDRSAVSGVDLVAKGRQYAKQNMWAMAAIHLRKAAGLLPNEVESRLALTAAYIKLKRYDSAARTLAEARLISPSHPQVDELEALLNKLRPESTPISNQEAISP